MAQISVVIPVGPSEANQRWLPEAIASVVAQTVPATIVLVDDMAGIRPAQLLPHGQEYKYFKCPWYMGVAHAFNIGVAIAPTELVFMLGSDDTLEPECLEECIAEYERQHDDLGYYFVGVRYADTGEEQTVACHAAMVTRSLWLHTGGFPVATASGAPDAAFISILLRHRAEAGRLWPVADARPLYNYRRHKESDTASKGQWQGVILATRDLVTREWRPKP